MNPWVEHLRKWLLARSPSPAFALELLQLEFDSGRITQSELLDLLDMSLDAPRTNAPGGAC